MSKIEWTEKTWNPIHGCTKVSEACQNCYAEVMARVIKTPTTTFITTSLVPLIPGGSLYYTMAYGFQGQATRFVTKGVATLALAAALALGIIIASTLTRLILKLRSK